MVKWIGELVSEGKTYEEVRRFPQKVVRFLPYLHFTLAQVAERVSSFDKERLAVLLDVRFY